MKTQKLGGLFYLAIVEGKLRRICVGDDSRVGDIIRFELRADERAFHPHDYFLARVRSIDGGVATIAITYVETKKGS
jgi:hypothetical protein